MAELAPLEEWSVAAALALGVVLPEGWLPLVRRAGLPITPLADGSFRPHRVVLEALEIKLRGRPERHQALHVRAGGLSEAAQNPFAALRHYRKAGRFDLALRLAEGLSQRFEARWEPRLVRQALEPLEAHLTPELRRALGHALLETGAGDRGEVLLRDLVNAGHQSAYLCFSMGVLELRQSHAPVCLDWADRGLTMADAEERLTLLLRLRATALTQMGRLEEAMPVAQRALATAEGRHDLAEVGNALVIIIWIEIQSHHLVPAEANIRRALEIFNGLQMLSQRLVLLDYLVTVLQRQGEVQAAFAVIEEALQLAGQGFAYIKPSLLAARSELRLICADFEGTVRDASEALELGREYHLNALNRSNWAHIAEAHFLAGREAAAHKAMEWFAATTTATNASRPFLAEALVALSQQDPTAARQHLMTILGQHQDTFTRIRARAYLADLACRDGTLSAPEVAALNREIQSLPTNALRPDQARLHALRDHCQRQAWALSWPLEPTVLSVTGKVLRIQSCGGVNILVNDSRIHLPLTRCAELLVYLALHDPAAANASSMPSGTDRTRNGTLSISRWRSVNCEPP
jgi:LuxR family transcriptional regulator, maltose regulon positive regulatory protein